MLYDPSRFEPLTEEPWDERCVRDAIRAIVADADTVFDRFGPRTGDGLWLERARRFAVHALAQARRLRDERGCGRYSLLDGSRRRRALCGGVPGGGRELSDARSRVIARVRRVSAGQVR